MSRRMDRLSAQLKRELAALIRHRVKDPRVGLVTVTHVRVTNDLTQARVFVRLTGASQERADALDGLEAAAPFLRGQLGANLKIRRAPELTFEEDESLDQALRIEQLLDEVRPEGGWDAGEQDGADDPGQGAPDGGSEEE